MAAVGKVFGFLPSTSDRCDSGYYYPRVFAAIEQMQAEWIGVSPTFH